MHTLAYGHLLSCSRSPDQSKQPQRNPKIGQGKEGKRSMLLAQLQWACLLKFIGPVSRGSLTVTVIIVSMPQAAGFSPESHVQVAVKVNELAKVL